MSEQAALMDAMYGLQRHFYNLTRKPYLLGRDTLIRELAIPHSGSVLEIACGTARNLLCIAKRYPTVRCFGVDISGAMLRTARASIEREKMDDRVRVACADATSFDPQALFGADQYDRVVISYALSMIQDWKVVLRHAVDLLAPGGGLYVVDFGDQAGLPSWFKDGLFAWLDRFLVTPRLDICEQLNGIAASVACSCRCRKLYRGYAVLAELRFNSNSQRDTK
jgi:S-adenosylmethionine-diacylgycerolhomoserine-N-methlytransferase